MFGTPFFAGQRCRIRTPTDDTIGVSLATANTLYKVSNLTVELEDSSDLWDGTNSQTKILPAGLYFFSLHFAADNSGNWQFAVYNDGVLEMRYGSITCANPSSQGFIQADGTSVYAFYASAGDDSKSIYNAAAAYQNLVLIRVA